MSNPSNPSNPGAGQPTPQPGAGQKKPAASPAASGTPSPAKPAASAPKQPQATAKPQGGSASATGAQPSTSGNSGTPPKTPSKMSAIDPRNWDWKKGWATAQKNAKAIGSALGVLITLVIVWIFWEPISGWLTSAGQNPNMPQMPSIAQMQAVNPASTPTGTPPATATTVQTTTTNTTTTTAPVTQVTEEKKSKNIVFIERGADGSSCVIATSDGENLGMKALSNDELVIKNQGTTQGNIASVQQLQATVAKLSTVVATQQAQIDGKMDAAKGADLYYRFHRPIQRQQSQAPQSAYGNCQPVYGP